MTRFSSSLCVIVAAALLPAAACDKAVSGEYKGVADEIVTAPDGRFTRDQWQDPVSIAKADDDLLVRYGACEHRAQRKGDSATFADSPCTVTIGERSWSMRISGTVTFKSDSMNIVASGGTDSDAGRISYSYRFAGTR